MREKMPGCVYEDPVRKDQCGGPIANRQLQMCSRHASLGRGLNIRHVPKKAPGAGRGAGGGGGSGGSNQAAAPSSSTSLVDLEIWENPPQSWRTNWCTSVKLGRPCKFGHTCAYAHSPAQLRGNNDPIPTIVFKPKIGAGDIPPPTLQDEIPPREPTPSSERKDDLSARHPLANVAAADIPPEICIICDDMYADRRWMPCGHMMCDKCMTNWRQQTIAKKSTGTTCPTCRSVVTGSESLPQAQHANGPKQPKAKSVWGNPDVLAANANKFVGSTLTVEEERAQESLLRRRLKEEQEARERQNCEHQEASERQQLWEAEQHHLQQARRLQELEEQVRQERLMKENRDLEVKAAREMEARRLQEAEKESIRLREERALAEREAREREEAAVKARQQQLWLAQQQAAFRQQQQHVLAQQQHRDGFFGQPQMAPAMQQRTSAPGPALSPATVASPWDAMALDMFGAPFAQLTDFQRNQVGKFGKRSTNPPPGFETVSAQAANENAVANPASLMRQAQASMSMSARMSAPNGANRPPAHMGAPTHVVSSQREQQASTANSTALAKPNATVMDTTRGLSSLSVSASNNKDDEDSDEDITEEERQKREEKRQSRMAQRKLKEEAIAKASQKQQSAENDFGFTSRDEYEMARAAHRKIEQEREDMLLAQKLADEERRASTKAPPPPSVPLTRADGKWNCSICTFENEPLYLVCAMCMTPRKASKE